MKITPCAVRWCYTSEHLQLTNMRLFSALLLAASTVSALYIDSSIPEGASLTEAPVYVFKHAPSSDWGGKKTKKDNWGNKLESQRRKITIRSSKNTTDDISADFLWAINKANHGGLLHLQKNEIYVIGTKLTLPVLDDVYIRIDGTLKVMFFRFCYAEVC